MQVELSQREAAQVLAALRNWQEEAKSTHIEELFEAYFEDVDPLSSGEIDALCEKIATSA